MKVGDRVIVHAGQWDLDDPGVARVTDPGLLDSFRVWGYDTCWGSFAQFCMVQSHQCLPKAAATHVGGSGRADAYRRDGLPDAVRLAAQHRSRR